ncbi:MAG: pyridoxamine 5'-phosphate oxidase [Bacteroidetes bacterium GWF2_42_66]|nr:MAG: pyridoxamine 5'-phosphate oxidase [Bacteroidetes bacterium GWA2_42_15]OFX98874.1 MAG: pyridoxamine 5'-phosphate oxidase [Bacteroidetes bacterium GWE2_42_39]OFY45589.1 MAG: pyridoxamine 5'-phosphate oxidase [Bacteroidetes bacterium GWF2_42_66]HBL77431.1 pyridoxamine 5'-phosphate oxidase [Prolixibacteraceae bacterium]HCU62405.1 pyridoxamine 5'-phosphate oxidase [Prolixibacteraceae bacterium]
MLKDIRNNYQQNELLEKDVKENPLEQFRIWLDESLRSKVNEPTAMVLSTVDGQNRPHARVVLLKEQNSQGFVFFTNYSSAKAGHIAINRFASLTFFWPELERQVRIDGSIERISGKLSDEYFASRPVDSRLGAWASPQSQVISSKSVLDESFSKYRKKFGDEIPRPQNWGGYLVIPYQIEFWQGRPNRLHDRICYQLEKNGWKIVRLAP